MVPSLPEFSAGDFEKSMGRVDLPAELAVERDSIASALGISHYRLRSVYQEWLDLGKPGDDSAVDASEGALGQIRSNATEDARRWPGEIPKDVSALQFVEAIVESARWRRKKLQQLLDREGHLRGFALRFMREVSDNLYRW